MRVIAVARTADPEMAAWPGVQFVAAAVEDADGLRAALKPFEGSIAGIYHLAGLVEHSRRRPEAMYRVHVAGTINVLRTAVDLVRARCHERRSGEQGGEKTRIS